MYVPDAIELLTQQLTSPSDHALMARGEDLKDLQVKIKKMSWKWSDLACTYMLRIENWPVALKDAFPGPGFSLGQIKGREAVRALEGMVDDMKIRYESAEEAPGEGVRIVSWTQGAFFHI
jgi:hypothetical protein